MFRKTVFLMCVLILLVSCVGFGFQFASSVGAATTWTVDDDGPADFSTIQEAVNAASDGDTIFVRVGTYYENVVVNRAVSLIGENSSTTIVDGNMTGDVVRITQDHVNITGFTIQRSGRTLFNSGISISSTGHCDISGNRIVNNEVGIYGSPRNASISNNTITNNHVGVAIDPGATCNIISGNCLMANNVSIHIYNANSNNIFENNITNNWRSITLGYSRNNRFYHNYFFNNTEQILIFPSGYANFWDAEYPSSGNYWDDYVDVDQFSGPFQNETGSDGIWDHPYVIDQSNTDHYPLVEPWILGFLDTDLNQDGTVNILDIAIVAKPYGTTPEDPGWNPIADLDDNEIIDIRDIAKVAKDYGKTV